MTRQLTPLGELIQARLDATGWSRRRLAREMNDSSPSTITNYMYGPLVDFPTTLKIRQLTGVLAMPERVVVAAALETVQLAHPSSGSRSLEDLIEEQVYLDEADKSAFKAWVRAKRRA